MKIPTKKLKNGFEMPVLGIGTSRMTGGSKDIDSIKAALELGYTHIDTAEIYDGGIAEQKVGEAIKNFDRTKLILTTKVAADHLSYDNVIKACKASLERLQTNFLDLYLIHWPNSSIPLKETMAAFDYLMEQGLIKNIGVSNFSVAELKEAQEHTQNLIVNNQIHYSISSQEPTNLEALKHCQENNILITAYSPLNKGFLNDNQLTDLSEKYHKTPACIALNWLISQKTSSP